VNNNYITKELTQAQQRIWYTQKMYYNSPMFNIGGYCLIHAKIDPQNLINAIQLFISSHDVFSISFYENRGEPIQRFNQKRVYEVEYIDFCVADSNKREFEQWVQKKSSTLISIEEGPLYRFSVFRKEENCYGYLGIIHHIIADGWSFQALTKEIGQNYIHIVDGIKKSMTSVTQYQDYISAEKKYLNSPKYINDKKFFLKYLENFKIEELAMGEDVKGKRKSRCLDEHLCKQIRQYCQKTSITINVFFISLYILYLYKTTGKTDIVIGIPVLGRASKEELQIIGMTVNSLPFRNIINKTDSIKEYIKNTKKQFNRIFIHQRYPYNHLVRELEIDAQSMFKDCVNYYHTSLWDDCNGKKVENFEVYNGEQQYNRQLIIREWSGFNGIQLDIDFKSALYSDAQIENMFTQLEMLINIIVSDNSCVIEKISLLTEEEKRQLTKYNDTKQEWNSEENVISMFEYLVNIHPHQIAIIDGDEQITYQELSQKSDQLASILEELRIVNNPVLGICTFHSIETVVGIIAIIKAGAAYVPIDPELPKNRMKYMLKESGVEILLTNIKTMQKCDYLKKIIFLDHNSLDKTKPLNSRYTIKTDDLAYILFTSGTTGMPKGVLISHKMLYNYIRWAKEHYVERCHEIMPLYSSLSFDLTVTSLFLPLVSGGIIRIYRSDANQHAVEKILEGNQCTIMKLTPSHLRLLCNLDKENSSLRSLIVGGEILTVDLAQQAYEKLGKNIDIYNEYGPTEATVGCMTYHFNIDKDKDKIVPCGIPIANMRIYLLDSDRNMLPMGCEGEIYIAGVGVSNGYLNCPQETAKLFIKDTRWDGEVLYKTGDRGIFTSYNGISCLGRIDNQVKINGYRVELQEIEKQLCKIDGISQAVVVLRHINGAAILCAYYVSEESYKESDIKFFLKKQLPTYMIPTVFQRLDKIPLTINGKIDARMLPLPDSKPQNKRQDNNFTVKEKILLKCIYELTGIDVASTDNFYQIGGDSIKAILLASMLKKKNWELKVREILANPNFNEMAYFMTEKEVSVVMPESGIGIVPQIPIVERFLSQKLLHPELFCQCMVLELKEHWEIDELQQIQELLIECHDTLRIQYQYLKKQLIIDKADKLKNPIIREYICSDIEHEIVQKRIYEQCIKLAESMQLSDGGLLRTEVFQCGNQQFWILMIHHLAIDGVSWRILMNDIESLMHKKRCKQDLFLPRPECSYIQWSKQLVQNSQMYLFEAAYWTSITDFVSFSSNINECNQFEMLTKTFSLSVEGDLVQEIFYRTENVYHITLEEMLLVSFILAFNTIQHREEIVIEIEGHGRYDEINALIDVNRTVGWFTCMYPIILECYSNDLDKQIKIVKEKLRNVPHHGLGYGLTSESQSRCNNFAKNMLRFNYLGRNIDSFSFFHIMPQFSLKNFLPDAFPCFLEINCILNKNDLEVAIRYNKNRLEEMEINKLICDFVHQIRKITEFCMGQKELVFTPSDFTTVDISQEALDSLLE